MTEIKKVNKIEAGTSGQSTQKPLLRVEHLKEYFKIPSKGYLHAVDDITMDIMPNETLGLVGEREKRSAYMGIPGAEKARSAMF